MRSILFAPAAALAVALLAVACSTDARRDAPQAPPAVVATSDVPPPPAAAPEPLPSAPLRRAVLRDGRAYDGAPPVIGHPPGLGDECLECHLDGSDGFEDPDMPPFTPHPELGNCRMCHVYVNTSETLVDSTYEPWRYALGARAHELAPPRIPHPLTMRERCVVCHNHGATSAVPWPADIAPAHSESWNCRMCHVPAVPGTPGPRPGATPLPRGGE